MADEEPTETPQNGIATALRSAFSDYVRENNIAPKDGAPLNVDLDFLKDHGAPLVTSLLKSVTSSLLPKDLNFSVPTEGDVDGDGDDDAKMPVQFDLQDFLGKLFTPPAKKD